MSNDDTPDLPLLPRDRDGPVFHEPWQAQAFGLVMMLYRRGVFAWPEWAERLAAQIAAGKARGDSDDAGLYYEYWLAALEQLIADRQLLTRTEILARKDQWERAARATPHGKPIELQQGH